MGTGMHSERPPTNDEHPSYVTVYRASGGWQSVCIYWCGDLGGYEEPWVTGQGPYRTRTDAITEATEWAQEWNLEARIPELRPGESEEAPGFVETLNELGLDVQHVVLDDRESN